MAKNNEQNQTKASAKMVKMEFHICAILTSDVLGMYPKTLAIVANESEVGATQFQIMKEVNASKFVYSYNDNTLVSTNKIDEIIVLKKEA